MRFSVGQLAFLVTALLTAFFFDFYLGARFGSELFWKIHPDRRGSEPLLPEEVDDSELEALLSQGGDKMVFHEVLEGKKIVGADDLPPHSDLPDTLKKVKGDSPKGDLPMAPQDDSPKGASPKATAIKTKKDKTDLVYEKKTLSINTKEIIPIKKEPKEEQKVDALEEKGLYSLQVGSFSEAQKARQVFSEFQTKGWGPFVKEVDIPDKGKWYRVYVGSYPTKYEAMAEKERIYQKLKVVPVVVKLDP